MQIPNTYIKPNILPEKLHCFPLHAMPNVVIPSTENITLFSQRGHQQLYGILKVFMHRMNVNTFLLNTSNVTENVTLFKST